MHSAKLSNDTIAAGSVSYEEIVQQEAEILLAFFPKSQRESYRTGVIESLRSAITQAVSKQKDKD